MIAGRLRQWWGTRKPHRVDAAVRDTSKESDKQERAALERRVDLAVSDARDVTAMLEAHTRRLMALVEGQARGH